MEFPLNKYQTLSDIKGAIGSVFFRGESLNIAEGLSWSRQILTQQEHGIRSGITKIVLVFATGFPDDAALTLAEVKLIKAERIRIITVGVGLKVSWSIGLLIVIFIISFVFKFVYLVNNVPEYV